MAVSGVIGGFRPTTQLVIDHAFRLVRLAPQQISGEYIQLALQELNLMLSSWATVGTPLWCQTKYILALKQGVYQLDVAAQVPGVVDILEANLRYLHVFSGIASASQGNAALAFDFNPLTACTQTTPAGQITLELSTAAPVNNCGIMPFVDGTWNVSLQYSFDGTTWHTFYTNAAMDAVAGQFLWLDFQGNPPAQFWRLQANDTTVLNVASLVFGNAPQEIPIARINKDDYWNLPNKQFQGRPVQYWCDRQIDGPVMWLWPSPGRQFVFQQVTILAHRQIMDAGNMGDNLEIPQRGFDAVVGSLGERLRMTIPEVDKQATADVPQVAQTARSLFWGEERDDSPINLQVDISAYTR